MFSNVAVTVRSSSCVGEWSYAFGLCRRVGMSQLPPVSESACRVTCHLTYLLWTVLVSRVRYTLRPPELQRWRCFTRIKSLLHETPVLSTILCSRYSAELTETFGYF